MKYTRFLPVLGAAAALAACDLSVTNPGPVQDAQLNTASAMPALVNGMSGDLSLALGNFLIGNTVMTDELIHSGNYAAPNEFAVGVIRPEDVDADYQNMQQARWVAEDGLRRMQTVLGAGFETNPDTPRAYLYAGFANRLLGENSCQAVIDGGAAQSDSVYFQRAESLFTRAYTIATALKKDSLAKAAIAGRASVEMDEGNWAAAVADAATIPATFKFGAVFSLNTSRENNDLAYETHTRRELTVWNTEWAKTHGDPRFPWDTVFTSSKKVQTGQDGKTAFFQQNKYVSLADFIPLAKGTEMLVLRAENALRNADIAGMTTLINQERAVYGLAAVAAPANTADAWKLLQHERGAVLWLEGRRLYDLRRWLAAGTNSFLATRDKCMPFGSSEIASNPNLH
jgi:hypothetical protein